MGQFRLAASIVELEKEAGISAEWRVGRGGTAGGAGWRVGGAADKAVVLSLGSHRQERIIGSRN